MNTAFRFYPRPVQLLVFTCSILGLWWGVSSAKHNSDVFEPIRDRLHHTTAYVPPFPVNDHQFLRAKDWPETMTIGGVRTVRRVHALSSDKSIALKSLKDARPGWRVILFYDLPETHWNTATAGWGPRYTWDTKQRLAERIWYEPDTARLVTHDYTYYKSGRLLGYSWRSEPRNQSAPDYTYEYLSQFYDAEGQLVAVAHEKKGPEPRSLYAWKGEEVSFDEFRMKTHVLYTDAR